MKGLKTFLKRLSARRLALAGALLGFAATASAQTLSFGKITDFKVPEYFDPPHQTQLKTLVHGASAEPAGEGWIHIKDLRIETFRLNGDRELLVEAPDCLYDPKTRQATSAGPISARTGDSQLRIQGEGFLFRQAESSLTISNKVNTFIRNIGPTVQQP